MSDPLEVHDVGTGGFPSPAAFKEILAGGSGPVAFCDGPRWGLSDFPMEPDRADVHVIVVNPGASGRGSVELMWRLWRQYPKVAALLGDDLARLGAVVFSEQERKEASESVAGAVDPLGMAVARAIARGTRFEADVCPSVDERAAIEPPALVPAGLSPSQRELGRVIAEIAPEWLIPSVQRTTRERSRADAEAIVAGLLLWHDQLDESHAISQAIEGRGRHRAGNYWHAIMHRREPDYGNSKYWFRQVGAHPIFPRLAERAAKHVADTNLAGTIGGPQWDAARFVDGCRDVARSGDDEAELALRRCQADEMLLLLEQTCRDAVE